MAEWLLLSGPTVLAGCEAPDKASAMAWFRPQNGQRVVSRASYKLDTEPRPKAGGSRRRKLRWGQRHKALRNAQQRRYRAGMSPERREAFLAKGRQYQRNRWKRLHPNATERPHKRKPGPVGNGSGG